MAIIQGMYRSQRTAGERSNVQSCRCSQAITERNDLQAMMHELEGKLQAAKENSSESAAALQAAQREIEAERASMHALQVGSSHAVLTILNYMKGLMECRAPLALTLLLCTKWHYHTMIKLCPDVKQRALQPC